MDIRSLVTSTDRGHILVASTSSGVCFATIGSTAVNALDDFLSRFSGGRDAVSVEYDDVLHGFAHGIAESMAGGIHDWPPLDLQGTPFQIRVWNALRTIPRGSTRSYGEIAALVGNPKATRAVARACGANPVAIAVPCHRVIGANGKLTGYRWGLPLKRHLLALECSP